MGVGGESRRWSPNLRDILRWQDRVAHVAAAGGWRQDRGGQVGEVGLDLGQRGRRHDEALLRLGRADHCRRRQGLRRHLRGAHTRNMRNIRTGFGLSELKLK